MANLPANRTKLQAAIGDQSQSVTPASGKKNREALIEAYDTIDMLNGKVDSVISDQNLKLLRTIADITYYVSATGNDENDGLTSATPLRNIQTAINKLPQIINHTVTITMAAGIYSEAVTISGFVGKGTLNIHGDTIVSDNYQVSCIHIYNVTLPTYVRGFRATNTASPGFFANYSTNTIFDTCKCIDASTQDGFKAIFSIMSVLNSIASSRNAGVSSNTNSNVFSANNSGTGNVNGLLATDNSKIGKYVGQPTGTTAESLSGGSQIV